MRDHEARFAAEFARSLGRHDWWNLRDEHTPYQWQCQLAMYSANPWGERRADLRAAVNSTSIRLAFASGNVQESDINTIVHSLSHYLPCDRDNDEEIEVDQAALNLIQGKE